MVFFEKVSTTCDDHSSAGAEAHSSATSPSPQVQQPCPVCPFAEEHTSTSSSSPVVQAPIPWTSNNPKKRSRSTVGVKPSCPDTKPKAAKQTKNASQQQSTTSAKRPRKTTQQPSIPSPPSVPLPTSSIEGEDVDVALWATRFSLASAEGKREIAFALMGLSPTTPTGEMRSRYLRLSMKVHPDKMGPSATERFMLLLKVYEFLTKT